MKNNFKKYENTINKYTKDYRVLVLAHTQSKIEKEIREIMQKNVAKYSLPYEYEFRDKLPKTLVGKVAFKELENEERKKRQ